MQARFLIIAIYLGTLTACNSTATTEQQPNRKEGEAVTVEKGTSPEGQDSTERVADGTVAIENLKPADQEFEVALGQASNGFGYSKEGILTYNGKSFKPTVTAATENVPRFKISLSRDKSTAGAIAMDVDGQNFLFLLDLTNMTATPMQSPESWNAAQKIFWSPSGKYMVAWCAYEGERFVSINLESKRVSRTADLEPTNTLGRTWRIDSEPEWDGAKDVLLFRVAEYCDPYEGDCAEEEKVLAKHSVALDATTLKFAKR